MTPTPIHRICYVNEQITSEAYEFAPNSAKETLFVYWRPKKEFPLIVAIQNPYTGWTEVAMTPDCAREIAARLLEFAVKEEVKG